MRSRLALMFVLLAGAATVMAAGGVTRNAPRYTSDFGLERVDLLVADGGNDFVSLTPGQRWRYEGVEDGRFLESEVTVLDEVRIVPFDANGRRKLATARVVEERERVDGELIEVTWSYFCRCVRTGNVYYLGSDVDHYRGGKLVGHDGSWIAGRDGARPGLAMPGSALLGARYYNSMAPGVSMDRAEVVDLNVVADTPAGVFDSCMIVMETSPLEPDEETLKVYGQGVGLIIDGPMHLVDHRRGGGGTD